MPKIQQALARYWPLAVALAAFITPVVIIEYHVLKATHGFFSYTFDDAFIHLSIAKNIAQHGIWSISPHEFTSASSSVLYPLLIAAVFKLSGPHTVIPFVLNLLAAIGFLIVLHQWLRRQQLSPLRQVIVLLAVVFLVPLPVVVIYGMEHTLQLLACFLFVYAFAGALEKLRHSPAVAAELPWQVYLYGALAMAMRYESIFLVGLAVLLLLTSRRWLLAFQLGLVSLLPVLVFGLYSLYKGSYFMPNSVLLKSTFPPLTTGGLFHFLTDDIFYRLYFVNTTAGGVVVQRLLIICPLLYLLWAKQLRGAYRYLLILLTANALLHLVFASTNAWFRYEAYLVGCTVPLLGVLAVKYLPPIMKTWGPTARGAFVFAGAVLFIPLLLRSKYAFKIAGQGCINVYEQQYQVARFVKKYYEKSPVALHDIGTVCYYSQGKHVDMVGLGNLEVTRAFLHHYATPGFFDWLTKKDSVPIAILYDQAFTPSLLRRWNKVASWKIPRNATCYADSISFYALTPDAVAELRTRLQAFKDSLPRDVVVKDY